MAGFTPTEYGPVLSELLVEERLNELDPGSPNTKASPRLDAITVDRAFAHARVRDRDMAAACLAGLWLYHDLLDESHRISQSIHTTTGSYWHGIMHRREPDYSNSKYWFRRVGRHPIFPALRDAAADLAAAEPDGSAEFLISQEQWDPFAFIDLVERATAASSSIEMLCRKVQKREWELLFDYSYRQAIHSDGA